MRKKLGIPFCILFGIILVLTSIAQTNATETMYSELSQELLGNKINIIKERRLFQWKNPEHFLSSFSGSVPVTFDGIIKGFATFKGNINTQEKILVIGGGLAYDDLKSDCSETFFLSEEVSQNKDRINYYPFNTYLIDYDGIFEYSSPERPILSFSDFAADITKAPNITQDLGLNSEFDIIILEHLPHTVYTTEGIENIKSLLKPEGILISDYSEVNEKKSKLTLDGLFAAKQGFTTFSDVEELKKKYWYADENEPLVAYTYVGTTREH